MKVCTVEAENGIAGSQNILGYMNQYGLGMLVNDEKTKEWYKKNCDNGDNGDNGDNDRCEVYQYLIDK